MQDSVIIDLNDGRVVTLSLLSIDEVNLDEAVKIDYNNLFGEYLTAPYYFNQLANLKATMAETVALMSLDVKVYDARLFNTIVKTFAAERNRKPSDPTINSMVLEDDKGIQMKKELIKAEKALQYLENIYWSMKEKCNKLDKIFHKVSPEEFGKEIVEEQVNNIKLKFKQSLIN